MNEQISTIQKYFNMWLVKDCHALDTIFTPTIHYVECYGAEYLGIPEIQQ